MTMPATGRAQLRGGRIVSPGPGLLAAPGPYVVDASSARRIPAVARALQLYSGLCKQMPLEAYRAYSRLENQPRLLSQPDPDDIQGMAHFVHLSVEDYLLNGNAISYVTARGVDGWPLSVKWLPTEWVTVSWTGPITDATPTGVGYYYLGEPLYFDDVIHVKRGADRFYPIRGVGVVEEFLTTLDRMAMEEEYERGALNSSGVPSLAVITPQATLTQEVADEAKASWLDKFSGPVREPVILPNGTVVQPLAWSPTDTQLVEARRMSLIDAANAFNLDGYWLGAPVAGMTYRSSAPQYQQILRTSLEPLLADFEAAWSNAWVPRGTNIRFERSQLLREDLATSAVASTQLYNAGMISVEEARIMVGLPPDAMGALGVKADMGPANVPVAIASPEAPDAALPEGEPGGPQP